MERGQQVDAIYTDFSKAFDRVNIDILLHKLSQFGFSHGLVSWFKSFLSSRVQQVRVGSSRSRPISALSGVPQGGHCSPLLFLIFINDIMVCFRNSHFLLFADDLKFYRVIGSVQDIFLMQEDLNRLIDWCTENGLSLNVEKCNYISFFRRNKKFDSLYNMNDVNLGYTGIVKDLGIYFDEQLNFNSHVNNIVLKASKVLGFVLRNCRELSVSTCKKIYLSLVVSVLEWLNDLVSLLQE